ncbi:hypothetical protein N3K66_000373 [Trichothecium roseum]|uniref:Uncharacterized protein n=1 Tax=Trichothecium roseum TaxID=47278 RepID=A0ACC0VC17_9HYPO|nr:hypothetical protein N3K66_000373 [Trichothecium roseum]
MSTKEQEEAHDVAASAKAVAISGAVVLAVSLFRPIQLGTTRLALLVPIFITVSSRIWSLIVTHYAPEPYLDEVFHIPQAQKFCEGRYREWDDKITTPPGLYLLPPLIPEGALLGDLTGIYDCSTLSLRAFSALGLLAVVYLAMHCRHGIEKLQYAQRSLGQTKKHVSQYAAHTALNVALFPLLFFFSGLYYTDVVSTAVVLGGFLNCLNRLGREGKGIMSDLSTFVLGILALFMRQTNVFWAVVFCGGLEAVHAVKTLRPKAVEQPRSMPPAEHLKGVLWRWTVGDVHDLPVSLAWPDDMLFTAASLLVAGAWSLPRVLRQIWPYVAVLLSFVAFVVWNEGVVLGDKSNHVATIHLAQMLYIWPLFAFFSVPLLLPHALSAARFAHEMVATGPSRGNDVPVTRPSKDAKASQTMRPFVYKLVVWALYSFATIALSFAVVHFNTIIHPFTLADNRHYMFYIFRYTIRRAWWVKYALVLPYTVSRWLVWGALERFPSWSLSSGMQGDMPFSNHPFVSRLPDFKGQKHATEGQGEETRDPKRNESEQSLLEDPLQASTAACSSSTAIIFLLATTLSLITAPLVEPRYFIIPWVIWRLFLPAWRPQGGSPASKSTSGSALGYLQGALSRYDMRLVAETAWFVAINFVTGAIFLLKPYKWKAEDGTLLDEGRLQRFMW